MYIHVHEGLGHDTSWYYDGDPTLLGLNQGQFWQELCGVFQPAKHGMTNQDVKEHIASSAVASGAQLRCVAKSQPRDEYDYKYKGDRQPAYTCFKPGASRVNLHASRLVVHAPPVAPGRGTSR